MQLQQADLELENIKKSKKNDETEVIALKKRLNELEYSVKKNESEKQTKENQIRTLKTEQQRQEAILDKLDREKNYQNEVIKFKI